MEHRIDVGSLGEQNDWTLVTGYEARSFMCPNDPRPCGHAHSVREVQKKWGKELAWTVPRVAVVYTQSGYDCTSLCLDCAIEAIRKLEG